jgi:hypothetical protein
VAGLAAGLVMPRGPVTTLQALAATVTAFPVGFPAGWVTRSRWTIVLAPIVFAVVVELVRFREVGPTVDWPPHTEVYGALPPLWWAEASRGWCSCCPWHLAPATAPASHDRRR